MKKQYALGFMFNENKDKVLLIKKNRPTFMENRLNGLGGKCEKEDGDNDLITMTREFKEECGIYFDKWDKFCELSGSDFTISIFRGFGDIESAKSITDEEVFIAEVRNLPDNILGNCRWLIEMALQNDTYLIEEL